jgi:hypothetical protein
MLYPASTGRNVELVDYQGLYWFYNYKTQIFSSHLSSYSWIAITEKQNLLCSIITCILMTITFDILSYACGAFVIS